ncbi:4-(cytidine 5'-diphospho)-2-C-methyl-D-erythritol kinase [Antarcticirhabdus aurantiaca]|uniref:4-(Cytidine 5'-diphospho)-2-C-methyl-D-erythritol kinase n=1 Tax=Antarcticirhabdus aurantiaca TaxID=2606717 RepID=A0ACD4NSY6_9HYPH|nr:4-(cytidine 5'-diphospho)-2-C-methyl-D-erythritol kinase [Antarcticirhabdus aurantiaca]WAJ29787.1 4-(cytidine 5'-diphospho)-2-C-methyl-D-erythritol kinase [Jeongeuplla avenae]
MSLALPEAEAPVRAADLAARAKINLALHVVGRRADGYHLLDSLVAFAEIGDRLALEPAAGEADELELDGPFAAAVPAGADNLVLRALAAAREVASQAHLDLPAARIRLIKRLPPASGIGGGSADAAALLAHVAAWHPALRAPLRQAGLRLGADVPMCFDGVPARVFGIGEAGKPVAVLPAAPTVLVNCGTPVSTPDVFRRLARRDHPPLPPLPVRGFPDVGALATWLAPTRNDLEAAAVELVPAIAEGVADLCEAGALFARMSGSGATVFGLFADDETSARAARDLAERHPGWWVAQTRLSSLS